VIDQISVTDLKPLCDERAPRLIDVRERWEYEEGHVPGAEWIPMGLVPLRKDDFRHGESVYVICRTGNRSGQVVMFLAEHGIHSINVAGGTQRWRQHGYPIETGSGHLPTSAERTATS
jgi:rhodanese-related sulfurtransferase